METFGSFPNLRISSLNAVLPRVGTAIRIRSEAVLPECLYFESVTFLCSLPGWFIAIPVVLFVSNFSGWRFWAMLALGAGIGPFVMFAIALYFQVISPNPSHHAPGARNLVFLATAVSTLTTALYLVVVRRWLKASPVYTASSAMQ